MWLQKLTSYLLAHRLQTIFLTFAITFIPVIGIFGILIAAFVTLRRSIIEGGILTIAATLPYILTFYLPSSSQNTIPLVIWAAVGVAVLSNLLTWIFAVMLRRGASLSLILQIAALIGVLVISVIHLIYPNVSDWWGGQLQSYYAHAQAMKDMLKAAPSIPKDTQLETINITKQYATGLMAAAILFNAVIQLIVARWWQVTVSNPGTLRLELHYIRLSQLAGLLFLISLIFSYLGNSVVVDIMPILCILFGAAGLSLIHFLFALMSSSTAWFWLLIFYLAVIFLLPTSMILVSLLALVDVFADLRKRFKKA